MRFTGKEGSKGRGFSIIELLIIIGVIVIITTVVILVVSPGKILKRSRDAVRQSEIFGLNKIISIFQVDNPSASLGDPSTIYLSLPDPAATTTRGTDCSSLNLPPPSPGLTYHCASLTTARGVDGAGWIPLNFNTLSTGPPFASLPLDPMNTTSSAYYAYATDGSEGRVFLVRSQSGAGEESDEGISSTTIIGIVIAIGIISLFSFLASLY